MSSSASIRPIGGTVRQSSKDHRPGVARLVAVELRKMVNTRSGFWVPIAVAALTALVSIIASSNHGGNHGTFLHVLHAASIPGAYLLPVMGVLLICSEYSQRTTLTTYTLVPSRWRVLGAKLGASLIVSTIATVTALLFAVIAASIFGHAPGGTGSLPLTIMLQAWLFLTSGMVMGMAFGAAILVSAPAIVGYLLLPVVWNGLAGNISWLATPARWLDSDSTLGPLTTQSLSGTQWAHAAATFALWIGVPLVIGLSRIGRGDLD
jgi:ABC-type transport system involved in multi-copper enzyme maturation permease subunit